MVHAGRLDRGSTLAIIRSTWAVKKGDSSETVVIHGCVCSCSGPPRSAAVAVANEVEVALVLLEWLRQANMVGLL